MSAAVSVGHALRHVETAVAGEAGEQSIGKAEGGRLAAGRNMQHVVSP